MRFDVPGGSSLVFSDAEGRVLDRPEVQPITRTVQVVPPGVDPV